MHVGYMTIQLLRILGIKSGTAELMSIWTRENTLRSRVVRIRDQYHYLNRFDIKPAPGVTGSNRQDLTIVIFTAPAPSAPYATSDLRDTIKEIAALGVAEQNIWIADDNHHVKCATTIHTVDADNDASIVPLTAVVTELRPDSPIMVCDPTRLPDPSAIDSILPYLQNKCADIYFGDVLQYVDGRWLRAYSPEFSIDLELAHHCVMSPIEMRAETALKLLALPDLSLSADPVKELCIAAYQADFKISRVPVLTGKFRSDPRQHANPTATQTSASTKTSVIIPTRDRVDFLATCVHGLLESHTAENIEVIIVDNDSRQPETKRWLTTIQGRDPRVSVIRSAEPFNWSRLNNLGATKASGDVLVFLNNDVEFLPHSTLTPVIQAAMRQNVGAVGALLLYPDNRVQHAGIVIGMGAFADHLFSGVPYRETDWHCFPSPALPRNVLACTGACLAISSTKFQEIGGFDERLKICGDIAVCVKLHEAGYTNLYEPGTQLIHHEFGTREIADLPQREMETCREYIAPYVEQGDPFFHPDLSLRSRYPTPSQT